MKVALHNIIFTVGQLVQGRAVLQVPQHAPGQHQQRQGAAGAGGPYHRVRNGKWTFLEQWNRPGWRGKVSITLSDEVWVVGCSKLLIYLQPIAILCPKPCENIRLTSVTSYYIPVRQSLNQRRKCCLCRKIHLVYVNFCLWYRKSMQNILGLSGCPLASLWHMRTGMLENLTIFSK